MTLLADVAELQAVAAGYSGCEEELQMILSGILNDNLNLTGTGFAGDAAVASYGSAEKVTAAGQQVRARFGSAIQMVNQAALRYTEANRQNAAAGAAIGA